MTRKPLLLLDVDGVVNAFAPVRPHVTRNVDKYSVRFDREVADMLLALEESFDIHWCSMWNHRSNLIARSIGVGPYPVMTCSFNRGADEAIRLGTPEQFVRYLWYAKTPLIPEYVQGRPFCWVDDDHGADDEGFLAGHVDQGFRLLRTDKYSGLTWEDVQTALEWAASLAEESTTAA